MKYRTLSLLGSGGIPYRKELRQVVGSVTGSILMQQLDYWFSQHPDGFYKFLDPTPNHPDYREGDSWTEELGFSKAEFRTAFDCIGVRHPSKSAYTKAPTPFESNESEKFYCSYHDKKNGLTWYFRNHPKVDQLIDELCKAKPAKYRKKPSSVDKQSESTVNQESESTVDAVSKSLEINIVDLHRSTNSIYIDKESESTFYIQKLSSEITPETTTQSAPEPAHPHPREGAEENPKPSKLLPVPSDFSNRTGLDLDSQSQTSASLLIKPGISPQTENPQSGSPPMRGQVEVITTFDKQKEGMGRVFNSAKGTFKSASSDPWMSSANNPDKDFSQWVFNKRYKDKFGATLADAKAEIRNDHVRASDLWDEYLVERQKQEARKAILSQQEELIKPETQQPRIGNSGHIMEPEERAAFKTSLLNKRKKVS